jgi:hypothetical protein
VEFSKLTMRRPDGSVIIAIDGGAITEFLTGKFDLQEASPD